MSTAATGSRNMEANEMALLSNILATYTFIEDQPERTALVFLGGVCVGLLVTLSAIVFQINCRADCHYRNSNQLQLHHKKRHRHHHHYHRRCCPYHQAITSNPDSSALVSSGKTEPIRHSESEDWDEMMSLSARRRRRFERALLNATMFTSTEELDQARQLEERERILHDIWMNGQPDICTVTQSLNRYF
ncbi:protein eva-1 homolog A [Takifugu flavidus]|uniref:EVA1 domain-containing protein n=1 Tax=Takifugu bimaculatus TaxID=433685 RepID=A0A4Z2BGV2_9TELE|nr:protein eva-1 homolog A [Takifugu flavidus]XP_056881750.1 protein eva-1 homolog A [Takifugu flavidus]TNM90380.1 hypothetical protein fugu_002669 [Takifugu bimaculatus]